MRDMWFVPTKQLEQDAAANRGGDHYRFRCRQLLSPILALQTLRTDITRKKSIIGH